MQEFIEELKFNSNVNKDLKIGNKVNIDYIIDKLEYIQNVLLNNLYYFEYHNKNLTKKQEEVLLFIKDYLTSKGVFEKNE
ncbi:hypothetical protein IKS57_03005 [bacterium]|nr:hypothetical protein [bacterium]